MAQAAGSGIRPISVKNLRLDPANPRLPPEFTEDSAKTQREIALYINKHYDPLRIAISIADHEFFESEPLIAVAEDDSDKYRVIEGNRRLCALLGLNDPELRAEFAEENKGWNSIQEGTGPVSVPVLVVDDPDEVAPLLGFRHISGIEPWDPYAQARYIAQLVDDGGHSLEEVAELVGRTKTEVSSKYRDYDVLNQADSFGLSTRRARDAFGVFNNAMGRRAIRAFIGAPDPRVVDPKVFPLPDSSRENLALLLDLVFGASGGQGRVITDSRQLGQLAQVLADTQGRALRVLIRTRNLEEALDAASDPLDQYSRAVKRARSELEKASELTPAELPHPDLVSLRAILRLAKGMLPAQDEKPDET